MPVQGKFDRSFQKSKFVARIVTLAFEAVGINRTAAQQMFQRVSELDFRPRTWFDLAIESKISGVRI